MRRLSIGELLTRADAVAARPGVAGDLAEAVRGRAMRRIRARRRSLQAGVAMSTAVLAVFVWSWAPYRAASTPAVGIIEVQRELASIRAEAESRLAVARLISETRRSMSDRDELPVVPPALAEIDALTRAMQEVERAGFIMVFAADRLASEAALHEHATAQYRQVVTLFPESAAARAALDRLSRLSSEGASG